MEKKRARKHDIKLFIDLGVVNCPVTHQSNFSGHLIISTPLLLSQPDQTRRHK